MVVIAFRKELSGEAPDRKAPGNGEVSKHNELALVDFAR
jgi:hypothetical protein